MQRNFGILTKKRKEHPKRGDGGSTAEADPGIVRRDEQGEAHRPNITSNGGPRLKLSTGRLPLKTWSKSDILFTEEKTWPTYIPGTWYIYLWRIGYRDTVNLRSHMPIVTYANQRPVHEIHSH